MGIIVRTNEDRNALQDRIAAELEEKTQRAAKRAAGEDPDYVKDSRYVENQAATGRFAWIWAVLVLLVVGIVIFAVIASA